MASDPNQEQPGNPNSGYGTPSNPYGAPENPYGAPQNPYGTPPPPENPYATPAYGGPYYQEAPGYIPPPSEPRPLGEAIRELPEQYVRVVTKPSPLTFAGEMGKARWDIVWIQLIGLAIINMLLGYLGTLISPNAYMPTTGTTSVSTATMQSIRSITLGITLSEIILIPAFFFLGMAILYGLAKAFGGQGRFVTQSYTYLLFDTPLGIISSIVSLIPFAGLLIAFIIGVYRIVLAIFSIMAVHRLSGGRATAVVLIPIGVALLLACGVLVLVIALVAAAIQQR